MTNARSITLVSTLVYVLGHLALVAVSLLLTVACASALAMRVSAYAILAGYFVLTFVWGLANGIARGSNSIWPFAVGLIVSSAIVATAFAWLNWSGISLEFGRVRDFPSFLRFIMEMRLSDILILLAAVGLGVILGLAGLVSGSRLRRTAPVGAAGR